MSFISHRHHGKINELCLQREDKLNALTNAMYTDLTSGLQGGENDKNIHVHTIIGQGSAFCAGNDIADFQKAGENGLVEAILPFLKTLISLKKPLVVGVNGPAVGIGTTLLLHADFVVASEQAYFQTPFVKLGLVPEAGSSLLAPLLLGHCKAFELLVMGEKISPAQALQSGIINKVTSKKGFKTTLDEAARKIAALPSHATQQSKALMKHHQQDIETQIDMEAKAFQACLQSKEAQDAFAAFLTKAK